MSNNFKFGTLSEKRLVGVDPTLIKVVRRALELSEIDFTIAEGLRTLQRQKQLLADRKTQTLKSNHLTGRAIDFVPYVNGKADWNTHANFDKVADAFRRAAVELGVKIKWGGCWLAPLNDFATATDASNQYVAERRKAGRKPFIDKPHVELA